MPVTRDDIKGYLNSILGLQVKLQAASGLKLPFHIKDAYQAPIELPDSIRRDMDDFVELVDRQDVDMKSIGLKGKLGDYLARLRIGFGLS